MEQRKGKDRRRFKRKGDTDRRFSLDKVPSVEWFPAVVIALVVGVLGYGFYVMMSF